MFLLLEWSPSPLLSPALISSVISSRLNANGEEAAAPFHSNGSFVIRKRDKTCRQVLCRSRLMFGTEKTRSPVHLGSWEQHPHIYTDASPSWISKPDLTKTIFAFLACSQCSWLKRERERKKKDSHRTEHKEMSKQAAAHTTQPRRRERRAARRQYQHRFCSHRSAGNYDNNVFPRQPLSDLVSEHLPFLKSPPDNIWYDYKVKILFKERPLTCL